MSAKDVTLNDLQELYVIPCEGGYTCLGYDVCLERSEKLAQWCATHNRVAPSPEPRGSLEAYTRYEILLDLARGICDRKKIRCDVDLIPQLVGREHMQVEVVDKYGERRRFTVGKSTGWMPAHLELRSRNDDCGPPVTGAPFQSVRVVSKKEIP